MDEKQFKKHLADLAHGHHHPEEHDWDQNDRVAEDVQPAGAAKRAKAAAPAKAKAVKKRAPKK